MVSCETIGFSQHRDMGTSAGAVVLKGHIRPVSYISSVKQVFSELPIPKGSPTTSLRISSLGNVFINISPPCGRHRRRKHIIYVPNLCHRLRSNESDSERARRIQWSTASYARIGLKAKRGRQGRFLPSPTLHRVHYYCSYAHRAYLPQ